MDVVVENILNRRYGNMIGDEDVAFLDGLAEL